MSYEEADEMLSEIKRKKKERTSKQPVKSITASNANELKEQMIGRNFFAEIDSRGRITIDSNIREAYDLKPGNIVYLTVESVFKKKE